MATASLVPARVLSAHASLAGELEALAERLRRITVRISTGAARASVGWDGVGAGIVWPVTERRAVTVVTNAHVVPPQRGDEVVVESESGPLVDGRVIARDLERDLALVALGWLPSEWPAWAPASIGDARRLRAGEIVVALGHPLGVGGALSVGIVHAVPNGDDVLLRADIRLAPGNSGGPLATLDGTVVGINCMIARGLGIAISAHVADDFVREATAR